MKKLLFMGVVFGAMCAVRCLADEPAAETTVVVPENGMVEFDVTGSSNVSNGCVLDLGAGATLKLVGSPAAGTVPVVLWRVAATNGAATIDASALGVDAVQFARGLWSTGTLTVTGVKKVVAGWEESVSGDDNFALCSVEDAAFTAADAQGIELFNGVTVAKLPPASSSCAVTIAPGARVAAKGKDALARFYSGGRLELTDWSLYMLSTDLVDKEVPIRVGAGCTLRTYFLKPFSDWLWYNNEYASAHHATNTVELLDATATFKFTVPASQLNFHGSISGVGKVTKNGNGRAEIFADCTAKVDLMCGGGVLVKHNSSTFGDETNPLSIGGSVFGIKPAGYETEETHVYVERISGSSGTIYSGKLQTFEIGLLDGTFAMDAADSTSTYVIDEVSAGVTIKATKPNRFVLKKSDANGTAKYEMNVLPGNSRTGTLDLDGEGIHLAEIKVAADNTLVLSGTGTVDVVTGAGKVQLADGAEITVKEIDPSVALFDAGRGKVTFAAADWRSKVYLWVDPSDTGSVVRLHNQANTADLFYTNNFPLVCEIKDVRPDQADALPRLLNNRHAKYSQEPFPQCYPFLVTSGGPNGLAYLSIGGFNFTGPNVGQNGAATREDRRLHIWTVEPNEYHTRGAIDTPWIVMVFGSQNGGGKALVTTKSGSKYQRNAATPTLETAIGSSATKFDLYVDGEYQNSTTAKFSGGWELISFAGANNVKGIGYGAGDFDSGIGANCGGQNYGEIIFFREMPTTAERIACERYLARKWGVAASRYTSDGGELPPSTTADEVVVGAGAKLQLNSDFRGTVNVGEGGELTLPAVRRVIGEAEVPSEGRLAWFDPNLDGALRMGVYPGRPLAVFAVSGRDNDGLDESYYLNGTAPSAVGQAVADRRPWLNDASRGGVATKWLDFSDKYADKQGNMLRIISQPVPTQPNANTAATAHPTRTAFVVIDSTNGGGTPIAKHFSSGSFPYRTPANSLALPIWSGVTDAKVTGGATRLDGVPVDGTVAGYSGRPEVLSLETTGDVEIGYFGIYGTADGNLNTAVLGEILLYDRVMPASDRADVEAYLMQKWLGKLPSGYGDFSATVLNGAGVVKMTDFKTMPTFGEAFTGIVDFVGEGLAFTVDPSKDPVVADVVELPGAMRFPNEVTFTFDCAAKPRPGTYPLIVADSVIAPETVAVQASGAHGGVQMKVVFTATSALLEVPSLGTLLIVR